MVEKVSIVLPAIYRPDLTQVAIDSIKLYTDCELILVQEGENEQLKGLMEYEGDKYIQNKIPKGYSGP